MDYHQWLREKDSTDLRSIISEGVVNEDHEFGNIVVCWAQRLELALLVSLLVILKLQVPESYNGRNTQDATIRGNQSAPRYN